MLPGRSGETACRCFCAALKKSMPINHYIVATLIQSVCSIKSPPPLQLGGTVISEPSLRDIRVVGAECLRLWLSNAVAITAGISIYNVEGMFYTHNGTCNQMIPQKTQKLKISQDLIQHSQPDSDYRHQQRRHHLEYHEAMSVIAVVAVTDPDTAAASPVQPHHHDAG